MSEKVISHLMSHRKKDWERLAKKYDPKGEYQRKYDEALKTGKPIGGIKVAKPAA